MKPKILTVDDSKTIRLIVTKALKPFDVDVLEASNGVEGVAVAMREKPDLILLDLTMPIMDGSECLAKLKSHADLKNIPVIMLTAESGRDNVTKIAKMGVRDYLVKPFKEDMLVERAGRIIELKAKGGGVKKVKRYDDPLNILVVDDKPAIIEQIKAAVSDTPCRSMAAPRPAKPSTTAPRTCRMPFWSACRCPTGRVSPSSRCSGPAPAPKAPRSSAFRSRRPPTIKHGPSRWDSWA